MDLDLKYGDRVLITSPRFYEGLAGKLVGERGDGCYSVMLIEGDEDKILWLDVSNFKKEV